MEVTGLHRDSSNEEGKARSESLIWERYTTRLLQVTQARDHEPKCGLITMTQTGHRDGNRSHVGGSPTVHWDRKRSVEF